MGEPSLKIFNPFFHHRKPLCEYFPNNGIVCKGLKVPEVGSSSQFSIPNIKLTLKPQLRMLISPIARPPRAKQIHWAWQLAIQFARLIKSGDIVIKGMAMNGRRKGCHYREAHPLGLRTEGCNTHYRAGTEANAKLEIRPVSGKNISRAYRFWVRYTKPLLHKYKGIIPVVTHGFYGKIGPNWNNMGPMCQLINLGPFSSKNCSTYDRYFGIPLTGSIPQNWVAKYGHLTFALDYPFNLKKTFTKGFLGVWGMVDRKTYRRMGIPYMTFPSRIDHVMKLLSTIDTSLATHVNLNKPYDVTGQKPHIEWLDLHNAHATLLLRDGIIDVPGFGKIVLNRATYLKEENLDRHPRLLAIAKEWRKHRKGGLQENPIRAKQLAVEYYRQRSLITKNTNRIEIRATAKNVTITIYNPAITDLELPLGTGKIKAEGLSVGKIVITAPSVMDVRYKRRCISDTSVYVEGLSARKLSFSDPLKGIEFNAADARIGAVKLDRGRTLILSQISSKNSLINISSVPIELKLGNSTMKNIRFHSGGSVQTLSIKRISTDIEAGRIGSVKFGQINVEAGRIGRGTLRHGSFTVVKNGRTVSAEIAGIIDVVVNKTAGSKLNLNVPGLEVSGVLKNIRIKGPACFNLTPRSWDLSKLVQNGSAGQKLSVGAQLVEGNVIHDPSVADASLRKSRHRRIIKTNMRFKSADLTINEVNRLSFLIGRGATSRSRFHHLSVNDVSLTNIVGKGVAWIKLPPWQYLRAKFNKLVGNIRISEIQVKQNGRGKRSRFKDVIFDLKETVGHSHKCYLKLPLLMFSPNKYFIGDPNGNPLRLNCRFDARLRGGYFHFRSKRRPLKYRRPYR